MTEYISKDELMRYLEPKTNTPAIVIKRYVEDMPSADVQPVKRGKWKHVAGMNSKCSVCSHYFPVIEFDSRPFDINFCPNCGARMDLKDGDQNE